VHRGGTTLFVTLDSDRYTKYRQQAAQSASQTANITDGSVADVELVITMIYSIDVAGNTTTMHNLSYAIRVLARNSLLLLGLILYTVGHKNVPLCFRL